VGVLVLVGVAVLAGGAGARGNPNGDQPSPIARGAHVSGVARYQPKRAVSAAAAGVSCSAPGSGNYRTDCNSSGRPVNETSVAYGNGTFYAGANDYNSYNGQGQDGFYWSSDGVNWSDAGPLDVFPHNNNNGAGDPGLAVDSNGVVYYSSLLFNFYRCNVGGVELLRRDPGNGSWSYYQIAANSSSQFQDKPAITLGSSHVYVSWTQFGSCSGSNVQSPIKVAVFPTGAGSVAPTTTLTVPGSTYSQGSSIASDPGGGFWIAWEQWPSATASVGRIMLAHWDSTKGWKTPQAISPAGFTDLPSSLKGFSFRTNSFPSLAVVNGSPEVVWAGDSNGNGPGQVYVSSNGSVPAAPLASSSGDQFFPSIASDGSVSYSQVNAGTPSYDQYLWSGVGTSKVSTAASYPNQDAFFSGQFIGDYNSVIPGHPIWTDIRGSDPNYSGNEMDSMFYAQGSGTTATKPAAPTLSAGGGDSVVHLSWTTPNDGGSTITNYKIYRGTTSGGEALLATLGAVTSYDDTSATNGTTYYYEVSAVNNVGEGPVSNEASATPQAAGAPQAPTNLVANTAKGKGVQLSWSASASSGVTYNVYRSTSGAGTFTLIGSSSSTSYKDTKTTRGATYFYEVTAVNSAGVESQPSNIDSATAA
jgi:Fibronectin type III domain